MSNQEYPVHGSSNLHDRIDLELLLHCDSLCDIRTERHAEAEIFVEIKKCHFDKFVDSIIISEFNY